MGKYCPTSRSVSSLAMPGIISGMEVYQSQKIHCDVGQVDTTLNVSGGELVDNAQAYVEHICPGANVGIRQKLREWKRKSKRNGLAR